MVSRAVWGAHPLVVMPMTAVSIIRLLTHHVKGKYLHTTPLAIHGDALLVQAPHMTAGDIGDGDHRPRLVGTLPVLAHEGLNYLTILMDIYFQQHVTLSCTSFTALITLRAN